MPGREFTVDLRLECPEPLLGEPRSDRRHEAEVGQVGEDAAAPQSESSAQLVARRSDIPGCKQPLTCLHGLPELLGVHRIWREDEPVTPVLGDQHLPWSATTSVGFECLAQVEHIGLNRGGEAVRRALAPQHVRQLLGRRPGRASNKQPSQDGPLLATPQRYNGASAGNTQRSEYRERKRAISRRQHGHRTQRLPRGMGRE